MRILPTSLYLLFSQSSGASPTPVQAQQSDLTGRPYLHNIAKQHGKLYFGTAVDIPGPEQHNVNYMTVLNDTNIFGQITPGNYMKFEYTEPQQGQFNYTGGDVVLSIAEAHGKLVRCHNLIWYNQLPYWLTSQKWTAAELTSIMKTHIIALVTHWGHQCYSWDVVNEALNENGTYMSNIWYNTIGESYVGLAFQFAQEAVKSTGKDIKLYYNDYNIEYPGAKNTAAANIVKGLQAKKIRIDGVGLESHFIVGQTPTQAQQISAMQSFTSLGIDVARTEIDVRFTKLPYDDAGLATQNLDYYNTIASCMAVTRCVGMTVWDFDDQYSWIPGTFTGQGGADLFNATFQRKPAFQGCAQALRRQVCTGCG